MFIGGKDHLSLLKRTEMSKIWMVTGCFILSASTPFGLHYLPSFFDWWSWKTTFFGWFMIIVALASFWFLDDFYLSITKKLTPKDYYTFLAFTSLGVIAGTIRWVIL